MTLDASTTAACTIITADSPISLIDQLERDFSAAPLSPFDDEIIVVQSLGMERWVSQELARRQGCAASLKLPFPASFCRRLANALRQNDDPASETVLDERFGEGLLAWRVFDLLCDPSLHSTPSCEALRTYLHGADASKCFGLARSIAKRFDDYLLYRPDVLLAWERGDIAADADSHIRWQAHVWQQLTAGDEPQHLARWFTETIEALEQAAAKPSGLPTRVSVFGVSTLPPLFVRLLGALSRFIPVRYYLLLPESSSSTREAEHVHPLVRAFGAASRELLDVLSATTPAPTRQSLPGLSHAPTNMLSQLQHDIRSGVTRRSNGASAAPASIAQNDCSLTVHSCHSPTREMEVLRDQLLDAFAADATLRPHDVLVLVPDVNVYAPLANAVFGASDGDLPSIPHRVADRPLSQDASPARAMIQFMELVTSRATASEVLDLLQVECVRRAAGITSSDVEHIANWVDEACVRWGRDGTHRAEQFGLPGIDDNSWRQGLDRLVMGYATGRLAETVGGLLPIAGDTLGEVELLGRFTLWVDDLFAKLDALRAPRPLSEWSASLEEAFDWLVLGDEADEQRAIDCVVDDIRTLDEMGAAMAPSRDVPFDVVRSWLFTALKAERHDTGFLKGGMTVCAIKPMRSIPFRIIAMLGLDNAAFPRSDFRGAFDLMEFDRRPGDRNVRLDDKQLFLDTLLCASDRLILSYVGRSQQNNSLIAPSVLISELLDELDQSFTTNRVDGKNRPVPTRAHIHVEHRLQPFSVAYFDGSDPRLFSFSPSMARSVKTGQSRCAPPPFLSPDFKGPAHGDGGIVTATLHDLISCWTNPAKFYCQHSLGLFIPDNDGPPGDIEPMVVGNLERTIFQQRMLEHHLAGMDDDERALALAIACGEWPSGALAPEWHGRLRREISGFLKGIDPGAKHESIALDIPGDGWRLRGRIDGILTDGRRQVRAATLKSKDLAKAWITHVALSQMMGATRTTLLATDETWHFGAIDESGPLLDALMQGYRRALQAPLPFFLESARKYHHTLTSPRSSKDPLRAATECYQGDDERPGEGADKYIALSWRGREPIKECAEDFKWFAQSFWKPLTESRTKSSTAKKAVAQ